MLELSSILSSLSSTSIASQLTSLRRDIISLYIERIARQPSDVKISQMKDISGVHEHKLVLFPLPPDSENPISRLQTLSTILEFLSLHLFPHLPSPDRLSFPRSLTKAVKESVLQKILTTSLPSSLDKLPGFLALVEKSIEFEEAYVVTMLGDDGERTIQVWADHVAMHYERKRRTELLEAARTIISHEPSNSSFRIEIELKPASPLQNALSDEATTPESTIVEPEEDTAWGFEAEGEKDSGKMAIVEATKTNPVPEATDDSTDENGWSFELDEETDPTLEPAEDLEKPESTTSDAPQNDDPWGWTDESEANASTTNGDHKETTKDDSVWDDPWDDPPQDDISSNVPVVAKPAKRLEKFSSKGKSSHTNGHSSPPALSHSSAAAPSPAPSHSSATVPSHAPAIVQKAPQSQQPTVIKESYLVSGRTRELLNLVQRVLNEADQLDSSAIFSRYPRQTPTGIIAQASSLILDLYRGLYPVSQSAELTNSPKLSMTLSNDCLYMSGEVEAIAHRFPRVKESFSDSSRRLKVLSEAWFNETVVRMMLRSPF